MQFNDLDCHQLYWLYISSINQGLVRVCTHGKTTLTLKDPDADVQNGSMLTTET